MIRVLNNFDHVQSCLCAVYKRMISLGDLPEDLKKEALRDDFNLDGLPQIISEVWSFSVNHCKSLIE